MEGNENYRNAISEFKLNSNETKEKRQALDWIFSDTKEIVQWDKKEKKKETSKSHFEFPLFIAVSESNMLREMNRNNGAIYLENLFQGGW